MSGILINLDSKDITEHEIPFASPIAGKGNTVLFKTNKNGNIEIAGIGSTEYGELGKISSSFQDNVLLSTNNQFGFQYYLPNISIITGGENFFGFVYVNNGVVVEDEVYTWGRNNKYQLGRGGKDSSGNIIDIQSGPGRIDFSGFGFTDINRIRTFQAGWDHAHIVTNDNRIVSWGNNLYGQLGISDGISGSVIDPSNFGIEPREIILSLSGDTPYIVSGGKNYSAVLTTNGNVYTYGTNDHYQLGISDNGLTDFCNNPIKINITDVKYLTTGESFIVVIRNDGTVWGWGDDTYGQISKSPPSLSGRYIDEPVQISDITDAVYASAGRNHVTILIKDGTIINTGDNQYKQSDIPSQDVKILLNEAIADNTFYVEIDKDVMVHGAGEDASSGLLGISQNTVGAEDSIKLLTDLTSGTDSLNLDIYTLYGKIITFNYILIPETTTTREIIKYDEDQTLASSEYMEQKKAICLVKNIASATNSTPSNAETCCSTSVASKPVIRFRSLKEQLAYEKGLYILDKKCLVLNT